MSDFKHFLPFDERKAGYWFACECPERPTDNWICFVQECHACRVAFAAAVRHEPERVIRVNKTGEMLPFREVYDRWRDAESTP